MYTRLPFGGFLDLPLGSVWFWVLVKPFYLLVVLGFTIGWFLVLPLGSVWFWGFSKTVLPFGDCQQRQDPFRATPPRAPAHNFERSL